jgi:hypothetical protein
MALEYPGRHANEISGHEVVVMKHTLTDGCRCSRDTCRTCTRCKARNPDIAVGNIPTKNKKQTNRFMVDMIPLFHTLYCFVAIFEQNVKAHVVPNIRNFCESEVLIASSNSSCRLRTSANSMLPVVGT